MCLRLEATADRWPAPLSSTSESSELVRACCTEDRIKAVAVSVSISSGQNNEGLDGEVLLFFTGVRFKN